MPCPSCGREMVDIEMSLRGSKVVLHACSFCETRWWDRDGETVDLDRVLSLVRR